MPAMAVPSVIPRANHTISRRDIDPDALKVLYRLRQFDHVAYLVGGSVRDLLLGRRPKDFDIGTSAHPYQVKKLFRNCWIIGRRFRLAHVRFGAKVIEVATFRRQVQPGEEVVQDGVPAPDPETPEGAHLIHHDNTFGTPEEDAFRRDFTINALFYDIATFSIIDYVNGLDDLRAGIVRSIGDPEVRFLEDPVRMLRAIALAARLGFTIEPPILEAIGRHHDEIARSSPARLLEEFYKILRSGYAEKTFKGLAETGLLRPIAAELHHGTGDRLWQSLAALDTYRRRFDATPEAFTNCVLLGTLLVPLGFTPHAARPVPARGFSSEALDEPGGPSPETGDRLASDSHVSRRARPHRALGARLGAMPLARRDVERLRQILLLQRRLRETGANARAQQMLVHRGAFREALAWFEIQGGAPSVVDHWKTAAAGTAEPPIGHAELQLDEEQRPYRRRRRRRRRRFRPAPGH